MKAKMNLHKLLSMLLALVMVVALIPATTAMAEEPTPESRTANFVDAPTVALNLLNTYKTGTEESTWDVNTNTLTLNGVNFETTANTALSLPEGSTIILHGENTITGVGSSDNPYNICYGIFVNNSFLTMQMRRVVVDMQNALFADAIVYNFIGAFDFTRAIEEANNTTQKQQKTA